MAEYMQRHKHIGSRLSKRIGLYIEGRISVFNEFEYFSVGCFVIFCIFRLKSLVESPSAHHNESCSFYKLTQVDRFPVQKGIPTES